MTDFMRDNIEIQAEWMAPVLVHALAADFEETVTKLGVVPARQDGDFKPLEVLSKMPFQGLAEVALPHIQRKTHAAKDVLRRETRH